MKVEKERGKKRGIRKHYRKSNLELLAQSNIMSKAKGAEFRSHVQKSRLDRGEEVKSKTYLRS